MVVTGRGPQPIWQSSDLRDAVVRHLSGLHKPGEEDEQENGLLDEQREIELVDRQEIEQILSEPEFHGRFKDCVEQVCVYTAGFPLTVRLIAQSEKDRLEAALSDAIDVLLEVIPVQDRQIVRNALQRMAVLKRAFREAEVTPLLAENPLQLTLTDKRKVDQIFTLLVSNSLMEWNIKQKGYTINRSLMVPIRGYMRSYSDETKKEYARYCRIARDHFEKLANDFDYIPSTHEYYQQMAYSLNMECN